MVKKDKVQSEKKQKQRNINSEGKKINEKPSEPKKSISTFEKDNERKNPILINESKGIFHDFKMFFKHPKKTLKRLITKESFIIYLISILAGIIGALAAWFLVNFIDLFKILFYGLIFKNIPTLFQPIFIIFIPVFVASVTAPILFKWAPEARGHGIPELMESLAYKDSYIRTATPYLKLLTSGINLGGGLSAGAEGPIAQIGAGFSSFLGRKFKLHGSGMRTIVVCGLVAGIAAIFNAPIGGVLFGLELLIITLSVEQVIPMIISSLIATTLGRFILAKGSNAVFNLPAIFSQITFDNYVQYLHWFLLFGIIAGLIAVFYTKIMSLIEFLVLKIKFHPIIWPIIGGGLTGAIGLLSPQISSQKLTLELWSNAPPLISIDVENIPRIFGIGYETISELFQNKPIEDNWTFIGAGVISVIVLLVFLKIFATSFSIGTGNAGGVFAPSFVIGALTGYGYASIIDKIFSLGFQTHDYALFTLVGLATVFAGASRTILTMIFMATELTHSFETFIPLMLCCSISYFISRLSMKETIYTIKFIQTNEKITLTNPTDFMEKIKVRDIMTRNVICLPENLTMNEFYSLAQTMDYFAYPVVDFQGKYQGIIALSHLKEAQINDSMTKSVMEFAEKNNFVAYPNDNIQLAFDRLNSSSIRRIAVLDSPDTKNLVGIISQTNILDCFKSFKKRDLEEEKNLEIKKSVMNLQLITEATKKHPELDKKVKVISRMEQETNWEKDLLQYLKETTKKSSDEKK